MHNSDSLVRPHDRPKVRWAGCDEPAVSTVPDTVRLADTRPVAGGLIGAIAVWIGRMVIYYGIRTPL